MPLRRLWHRLRPWRRPVADRSGRAVAGAVPSGSALNGSTPAVPPAESPTPSASTGAPADHRATYLRWLLATRAATPQDTPDAADRVLAALDAALGPRESCDRLLRRAPDVVPRLINSLRDHNYSRNEVARHIERDVLLTAEVLRMARSTLYAHLVRGAPTVVQAVDLLGRMGLKQVIARALLRPLLTMGAGGLQLRAAPRIWEDAERCALLCTTVAPGFRVDPGDAYLAGLFVTMGWSAALRALEVRDAGAHLHDGMLDTPGLADALYQRRDRIVARLLATWAISPALTAMGRALAAGPGGARPPLLALLPGVEDMVRQQRLGANGGLPPAPPVAGGLPAHFLYGAD